MNPFDLLDNHLLDKLLDLCGPHAFQAFKSCRRFNAQRTVFIHRNTEIEKTDGEKWWILFGRLHREDSPAVEQVDGTREWWLNGKRHREDGPAKEHANGDKEWWLNNTRHYPI